MNKTKRVFDISLSVTGLLVTWPIFLVIAAIIKAEDSGPIFFLQERVGKGGRPFRMWKFRTMVPGAERIGRQLTVGGDSRITSVGAWLRRKKLDELPQLFNVILGEMSFVGPRPEVPKYVANYTDEQRKVLELQPGITDVASLAFSDESTWLAQYPDPERLYVERIVPEKIRLNLAYAKSATAWDDLGIVFHTIRELLSPAKAPRIGSPQGALPISSLEA